MSQITRLVPASGPGSGTVTSVSGGNNITITGNPAVNPTVNVSGTTNHAVQVGNASGSLTSIPVGLTGEVLTGVTGSDPIFAAAPSSGITITGDSGGALGPSSAFTFTGGTTNGTAEFSGAGTTETLTISDADFNTVLGTTAFKTTHTPAVAVANTGLGVSNLNSVTTASGNVAIGFNAGASLLGGINNTIVGTNAMGSSTSAQTNTALGASALTALISGSGNLAVGTGAGSNYAGAESDNILVGSLGVLAESAKIRIGTNGTQTATFIVGIDGVNVGSVAKVVTMASDQLGTATITGGTGITVTPSANTITIAGSGLTNLTVTTVNNAASPYTVLTTDSFLAVNTSGGAVTIRLPNAPATGRVFYVKDSNGTAAASNITVTTVGGAVLIDGATSFVMNTALESISVVFDGVSYEIF